VVFFDLGFVLISTVSGVGLGIELADLRPAGQDPLRAFRDGSRHMQNKALDSLSS